MKGQIEIAYGPHKGKPHSRFEVRKTALPAKNLSDTHTERLNALKPLLLKTLGLADFVFFQTYNFFASRPRRMRHASIRIFVNRDAAVPPL